MDGWNTGSSKSQRIDVSNIRSSKRKSLESSILFILDRLTPINFESLAEEMTALNIKTYDDLLKLVQIFFDKVTIETKSVEAYAKLCLLLKGLKVPPLPNSDMNKNHATFRLLILTKCQMEFEADKTVIFEDPEEKKQKIEAEMPEGPERDALIDNALYQMKMRRLKFYGNIRFIGELFKLNMLTENIMHDCISQLLKAKDDDSLLCLCILITTVGHLLDTDKARQRMDLYFAQMAKIAEERKSRIKFALKDVINLRNNNWVPHKEPTGPKKLDEVYKTTRKSKPPSNLYKLNHCPFPWRKSRRMLGGKASRKSLESSILFIMNRLTPTNFERLAIEMIALNIETYDDLRELVWVFFNKVTLDTMFIEAYAKLCLVLAPLKVRPPPNSGLKENQATFRVVMLTKCQQEFEADKTVVFEDPEEKKRKIEAEMPEGPERDALIDNTLRQMKMRQLKFFGNIRFIGELFKVKLLTENIMHDCIYRLLKAKDDDSLLSLCILITTVGHLLDTDKARLRMDSYFAHMAKIAEESKSRIKFTLKDVIDLRNNNWVPRKEQTGPKKIDEVHKDNQQEQATKQFMQTQPLPPRLEAVQQNARPGSKQRQEEKQVVDEEWNTVGSKTQKIDESNISSPNNVVDESSIQPGPGRGFNKFSIWSRGNSAAAQQPAADERSPSNRHEPGQVHDRSKRQSVMEIHCRQPSVGRRHRMMNQESKHVARILTSSRESSWRRKDWRQLPHSRDFREAKNPQGSVSESRMQQPAVSQPVAPGSDNQQVKKLKPLSVAEMEQKAKTILQEYLGVKDLEEAKLCVLELRGQEYMHQFVTTCFNEVLERAAKDRHLTGSFFHEIFKEGLLPLSTYLKGLSEVLSCAEDIVIDIPKLWTCLAQIIAPMLVGGSLSWSQLSTVLKSCLSRELSAVVLAEILLVMKEKCGEQEVAAIWQESGLDWSDFLEPLETSSFLQRMQLEFTQGSSSSQPDWQRLADDIEALVHKNASKNDILSCIQNYNTDDKFSSKQLVRATVTAILNAAISASDRKFHETVLKSYKDTLLHYVKGNPDLELEVLYAVQALMHKLDHPQGVISSIYDAMYEEEIISEEVLKKYEKNDGEELKGRGTCLLQLLHFYSWLQENKEPETA